MEVFLAEINDNGNKIEAYEARCPHCNGYIVVSKEQVACKIFRHAVVKSTGQQTNPHESKIVLNTLLEQGKLYGCGKPFKFVETNNKSGWMTEVCEYI